MVRNTKKTGYYIRHQKHQFIVLFVNYLLLAEENYSTKSEIEAKTDTLQNVES